MSTIRVMLVDDHQILIEGLRTILAYYPEIEIVGEAHDGAEAIEEAARLAPDVVVMDIGMPGTNGVVATEEIRKANPDIHVLALTQHEDRQYILSLLKAGAEGYMLKGTTGAELVNAIKTVSVGGKYLQQDVSGKLIEELHHPVESLTPREREVLTHIAQGESNAQIAEALYLSVKTVEWHRTNLMSKCHAHNVVELVNYARDNHLLDE